MAKTKKSKAPKPDDDGERSTGIYTTHRTPMTAENVKAYCESFHMPAADRVAEIHGRLVKYVLQYLEGPYTQEQYKEMAGTRQVVDTGRGNEVYCELPIVDEQAGSPHILQYHNAVDALAEISTLIAPNLDGGNQDLLVSGTLRLGRLLERIEVRPHEPNTLVGRRVTERSSASGKLNAALTPEQKTEVYAKVDELIVGGKSQNKACSEIAPKYQVSPAVIARAFRELKSK